MQITTDTPSTWPGSPYGYLSSSLSVLSISQFYRVINALALALLIPPSSLSYPSISPYLFFFFPHPPHRHLSHPEPPSTPQSPCPIPQSIPPLPPTPPSAALSPAIGISNALAAQPTGQILEELRPLTPYLGALCRSQVPCVVGGRRQVVRIGVRVWRR